MRLNIFGRPALAKPSPSVGSTTDPKLRDKSKPRDKVVRVGTPKMFTIRERAIRKFGELSLAKVIQQRRRILKQIRILTRRVEEFAKAKPLQPIESAPAHMLLAYEQQRLLAASATISWRTMSREDRKKLIDHHRKVEQKAKEEKAASK